MCFVGGLGAGDFAVVACDTIKTTADASRQVLIARGLISHAAGWGVLGSAGLADAVLPAAHVACAVSNGDPILAGATFTRYADEFALAIYGVHAARPGPTSNGWLFYSARREGRAGLWALNTDGEIESSPVGLAAMCAIPAGPELPTLREALMDDLEAAEGPLDAVRRFLRAGARLRAATPLVSPYVCAGLVEADEGAPLRSWCGPAAALADLSLAELEAAANLNQTPRSVPC